MQQWLTSDSKQLVIKANSAEEILAFIYSVIDSLNEQQKASILGKIAVVTNPDAIKYFTGSASHHIIIPIYDLGGTSVSLDNVRAIITTETGVFGKSNDIELSPIDLGEIRKYLEKEGIAPRNEIEFAQKSKGNFLKLSKLLSRGLDLSAPEWSINEHAIELAPLILIGAWDETKQEDRNIVEAIFGKS